jgi:hypothetical protein
MSLSIVSRNRYGFFRLSKEFLRGAKVGGAMNNLGTKICCVLLVCTLPLLTHAQKPSLPTQRSLGSAVDLADTALKDYQKTLGLLKEEPLVAETSRTDAEPIMIGEMSIILLKTKASQDGTVDVLELAALAGNVDAAALNAALTAGTLGLKVSTVNLKQADKILNSANALIADAQQLRKASDALWELLEACLSSQPPLRLKEDPSK